MKTANFPGRKMARRLGALARLPDKPPRHIKGKEECAAYQLMLDAQCATLIKRTAVDARGQRSKRDHSDRAQFARR